MLYLNLLLTALLAAPLLAQSTGAAAEGQIRTKAEIYVFMLSLLLASLFLMVALITLVRMFRRRRDQENTSPAPRTSSYVDVWGSYRLRPQDIEIMEELKNGIDLTGEKEADGGDPEDDWGQDFNDDNEDYRPGR